MESISHAIKEQRAVSLMESMKPEAMNGSEVKPPRPPPAKNDSPTKTAVSLHLFYIFACFYMIYIALSRALR